MVQNYQFLGISSLNLQFQNYQFFIEILVGNLGYKNTKQINTTPCERQGGMSIVNMHVECSLQDDFLDRHQVYFNIEDRLEFL